MVRLAILGVAVLFVGINLTFRVIIFALAGGMGPMPLLQAFFYGGIVLNFLGFSIVVSSILSRWSKSRKP
jgi:hypothetical protein